MRILFISSRDVSKKSQGAPQCTNRNYISFCSLAGNNSVEVINVDYKTNTSLKKKVLKRISLLFGFYWGLSHKKISHIIDISKEYEFVFIDSSLYGILAYYLKRANYKGKIICHFHNVEFVLRLQKALRNPLSFWEVIIVYLNEKRGYKNSDYVIALNKRDSDILQKTFGSREINIIPISMIDTFRGSDQNNIISIPPTFLFFGSNHYANYHGIKWFVRNVLNHVDIKLQIVGTGMEKFKKKLSNPKVEILGFVPDLSEFIMNSDFILSPVFKGSGMKVKTCEALMFGKNIIGTTESFEGYDVDPVKAGAVCNSKKEFIETINAIKSNQVKKFNDYNRKCYKEKYSFDATLIHFKELLS
jgi:polysaccharide biosynthesis protein PslH